jgi:anti-sigma factor ChrR (cupin superfamily)
MVKYCLTYVQQRGLFMPQSDKDIQVPAQELIFDTNTMDWQTLEHKQKIKYVTSAEGVTFVLSEVPAGCSGPYHVHQDFECVYILEGSVISNGVLYQAGQGYIAGANSEHHEFRSETGAKFIVVLRN